MIGELKEPQAFTGAAALFCQQAQKGTAAAPCPAVFFFEQGPLDIDAEFRRYSLRLSYIHQRAYIR